MQLEIKEKFINIPKIQTIGNETSKISNQNLETIYFELEDLNKKDFDVIKDLFEHNSCYNDTTSNKKYNLLNLSYSSTSYNYGECIYTLKIELQQIEDIEIVYINFLEKTFKDNFTYDVKFEKNFDDAFTLSLIFNFSENEDSEFQKLYYWDSEKNISFETKIKFLINGVENIEKTYITRFGQTFWAYDKENSIFRRKVTLVEKKYDDFNKSNFLQAEFDIRNNMKELILNQYMYIKNLEKFLIEKNILEKKDLDILKNIDTEYELEIINKFQEATNI